MSVVIVTAVVQLSADTVEEALALSLEHVRRSRTEPGCLLHTVSRDAEDPTRLIFLELWADRAALDAHFLVPEARRFVRALGVKAASRQDMRLYEAEAFNPEP